jgi:hypothetical protein
MGRLARRKSSQELEIGCMREADIIYGKAMSRGREVE